MTAHEIGLISPKLDAVHRPAEHDGHDAGGLLQIGRVFAPVLHGAVVAVFQKNRRPQRRKVPKSG